MREAILELTDVGVTYANGVRALAHASLSFRAGEFTVLLGASGAGKSTLLRTLNQLVTPTQGLIEARGIGRLNTNRALRRHRRSTAMVFQRDQLIARLSALDNVLTGRLPHHPSWRTFLPLPRRDLELALHCLQRVGLADRALTRVDQLSGGQRQRVGIARALAQEPRIILADEPVASLDPVNSDKVLGLLRSICEADGITAIVSLHQLEYALRYADRIVGLAHAQVVFDGSPGALDSPHLDRIYGDLRRSEPHSPLAAAAGPDSFLNPSVETSP